MTTWNDAPQPASRPLAVRDRMRIARRAVPAVATVAAGLALLLTVRLFERPLCGARRPVTPWIARGVCIIVLRLMGLRRIRRGAAMRGAGAVVANHVSWLDILVLNAGDRVCFVAKAEVAGWPGIGWLARATGTLFIRRDPREAAVDGAALGRRLAAGHRLVVFPEGTSTDGQRVLPFKSTLFAAFTAPGLRVQPVTLRYVAPAGLPRDFYGWWGDRDLAESLLAILSARRQGRVEVTYHGPLDPAASGDRKTLARTAEAAVRCGLT